MIYLSMPPWPGLPPNPKTEGHYWIVSKNLVELIACLLIAVTASGYWFGLDGSSSAPAAAAAGYATSGGSPEKYGLIDTGVSHRPIARNRPPSRPDPDPFRPRGARNDQPDP